MAEKITKSKKINSSKSKIVVIQEMYGKDTGSTSLEETSNYLKKAGFKSLADLLYPAK